MLEVLQESLMITSFVAVMMVVLEYINVQTQGEWQKTLSGSSWKQYLVAAFLGVTPGCLGAFAVVAMYVHGVVSAGAVVTAMIATAGDESFVMLAMIPRQSFLIFGILFTTGIFSGALSDILFKRLGKDYGNKEDRFEIHNENKCNCLPPWREMMAQWKNPIAPRYVLTAVLAMVMLSIVTGNMGPDVWNWIRVTLLIVSGTGFFVISTVPDHFLENHVWEHVIKEHVPRIFVWTFGTLVLLFFLTQHLHVESLLQENRWMVLLVAALIGVIPQSGLHLIFVTLYAKGIIPLSTLLASSIVQDGHGMIPLLAKSRRDFIVIKSINLVVGILIGACVMLFGY